MNGNIPPHDLGAEQCVLDALLSGRSTLDEVQLQPEDWYSPAHRDIHQACLDLASAGAPIDAVSVAGRLRDAHKMSAVGGAQYLADILSSPAGDHVHACSVVADRARTRRLIEAAHRVAAAGYGSVDSDEYYRQSEGALYAAMGHRTALGSSVCGVVDEIHDELQAEETDTPGLTTGLRALDEQLGGLEPGRVYVVAGRPGMGKSALALRMALAACSSGAVLFSSMEMSQKQLLSRAISDYSGVPHHNMRTRRLTRDDWVALVPAISAVRELPLTIRDAAQQTIASIMSAARRIALHHGALSLIVVDYIQLMTSSDKRLGNREQEIAAHSRGLKVLAKELSCPVVVLSQLNRAVEQRPTKRPHLCDLRESGAIEQDADAIVFLYRPGYYLELEGKQDDTCGRTELIVEKQRNGPTGSVFCKFDAPRVRYVDE